MQSVNLPRNARKIHGLLNYSGTGGFSLSHRARFHGTFARSMHLKTFLNIPHRSRLVGPIHFNLFIV